jgi:DHA3 family tetracycline resistance protein-like MFS transporter
VKKLDASFVFLLVEFIVGFATKLIFTTYVIYRVDVVGLDPLQLVLLGTALETTIFLFEVPTGVVADLVSRRLSTIIGVFLVGLGWAIEGVAPLFWVLLVSQFVWGLGHTFISGAFVAWVTDEVGIKKVGDLLLRGNQLSLLGNLLGIPAGVLVAGASLALPYLVGGSLLVLLAIFLAIFMPEHGFKPVPRKERQGWQSMVRQFQTGLGIARRSQALMTFAVIGLFVGLYSEAWDRLAQPHLLQSFPFPKLNGFEFSAIQWFGILNVAFILVGMAANEIAKRLVDTTRSPAMLRALQGIYAAMVLCMLVFTFAGEFYLAVAMMIAFNALRGVTFPLTSAWINQQIDSKARATLLSMTGQIDALGELSGGPILGSIGRFLSLRTALVTSAGLLSLTVPLYQRIRGIVARETDERESTVSKKRRTKR